MQVESLVNDSLHQHLQINLLSIIGKFFLCLPTWLKLNKPRYGNKRSHDEDTGYAAHATPSCGVQKPYVLGVVVTRRRWAREKGVYNPQRVRNVHIASTSIQSQLNLQPAALWQLAFLIAFHQQLLQTSIHQLIGLAS